MNAATNQGNAGVSIENDPGLQEGGWASGVQGEIREKVLVSLDDRRMGNIVNDLGLFNAGELRTIGTILGMAINGDVNTLKKIQKEALMNFFRDTQFFPKMKTYEGLFALLPETGAPELLEELGISLPSRKKLFKTRIQSEWLKNHGGGQGFFGWLCSQESYIRQLVSDLKEIKGVTIEDDMGAMNDATRGTIAARIFEEMLEEGQEGWADSFKNFCEYLRLAQDSGFQIDLTCISLTALQEEMERIKKGIQKTGGDIHEILCDNVHQIQEYNEKVQRMGHPELEITERNVKVWVKDSRVVG